MQVVYYIFAIVFSSLKESTYETKEKKKYFTSKALFVLENEILEICIFKLHDIIKCLSIKQAIHFTE